MKDLLVPRDFSVKELEARFAYEEERLAEGKPIKGAEFFAGLRERLAELDNEDIPLF